jgi:hypothetical protein
MKTFTLALARGTWLLVALSLAAGCESNTGLGNGNRSAPTGLAGTMGSSAGSAGASSMGAAGAASTGAAGTTSSGAAGTGPGLAGAAGTAASGAAGSMADPGTLGTPQAWQGYIENHMFPSGSDMILLKFATDARGVVAGSVVFGVGTPPPPATDPNVGYPSNLLADANTDGPGLAIGYVAEGYSYAFDGGSFDGHRLRFTVNFTQLWAGWCALQTPASDGSGWCLPNWGTMSNPMANMCAQFDPKTKQAVPVDCGKLFLCDSPTAVCACGANTCGVSTGSFDAAMFDVFLILADGTGSGSASQSSWGTNNVHFVKN